MNTETMIRLLGREKHGVWVPIWTIDACKGDMNAARMLSQLLYWFAPDAKGGRRGGVDLDGDHWVAKPHSDWHDEIRLTPPQAKRASAKLQSLGLIDVAYRRFNGLRMAHYRLRSDEIVRSVGTDLSPPDSTDLSPSVGTDLSPPLTETTTEITANKENNDAPNGAGRAAPRWQPAHDLLVEAYGETMVMQKNGRPRAWVGRLLALFGEKCDHDVGRTCLLMGEWIDAETRDGDGRPRFVSQANAVERSERWMISRTTNGKAIPAGAVRFKDTPGAYSGDDRIMLTNGKVIREADL